ncbi:hypothetical protein HHX47_DHR1000110 [Lentinula edodes]|nr:hypothetical protein HHX47_DHR1000110 [Lentinula edodes]
MTLVIFAGFRKTHRMIRYFLSQMFFLTTTVLAFVIRIFIALCTRTVFQPDEYFQALEPAHHIVFGYGHLTWEWLSPQPIRSIVYPALNVPIYWILKQTGVDSYGRLGDFLMLLLSLTSLFHALSLSRSLSNSLETSLTTIALTYYPWDGFFAAQTRGATIGIIFVLDTIYYAQPTFTPFSFLVTNLSGVSLFYGNNPWHYYLSQALPILCTTSLPFVLDGIWSTICSGNPALQTLLGLIVWTIGVYSLAGHKEWRFIHPLLPILHILAAKSLVERSSHKVDIKEKSNTQRIPIRRAFLGLLLVTLPISTWIVFVHCSGPLSVMSYIRNIPENELRGGVVGFLMPCHSTPGHAYLHRPQLANGGLWALGCEPPLK